MGLTSRLSDNYDDFSSFLCFFFFALESDEDVSENESDNEGSGSRFSSGF